MRGIFISIEGAEGCGKSTQAAMLETHLKSKGLDVLVTREPGGTAIGEALRAILLDPANSALDATAELLLYEADRAQHVNETIAPALEAGTTVICDRFSDSTTAYQGGGRGVPTNILDPLQALATGGLSPDLTILLDLPVEKGLGRARRAGESDRLEQESLAFHNRVRSGFLCLAEQEPERVKLVDGSATPEAIARRIQTLVAPVLEGLTGPAAS